MAYKHCLENVPGGVFVSLSSVNDSVLFAYLESYLHQQGQTKKIRRFMICHQQHSTNFPLDACNFSAGVNLEDFIVVQYNGRS